MSALPSRNPSENDFGEALEQVNSTSRQKKEVVKAVDDVV